VIHREDGGYADASWFYEVVPELEALVADPGIGHLFGKRFNRTMNEIGSGKLKLSTIFFEKYVPGIDGISMTCFKVSLPRKGAGERWVSRNNPAYEVRLSVAKPQGQDGQRVEYVSHTELDEEGQPIFATWNPNSSAKGFDQLMTQEYTHIPWEQYDFQKFSLNMPLCQCRNQKS